MAVTVTLGAEPPGNNKYSDEVYETLRTVIEALDESPSSWVKIENFQELKVSRLTFMRLLKRQMALSSTQKLISRLIGETPAEKRDSKTDFYVSIKRVVPADRTQKQPQIEKQSNIDRALDDPPPNTPNHLSPTGRLKYQKPSQQPDQSDQMSAEALAALIAEGEREVLNILNGVD